MHKKWILGLDSLRIVLAIIVLLSHLDTYSIFHSYENQYVRLFGGLIGNTFVGICAVIAFFIVSGIVIHFPYEHGKRMVWTSFIPKRLLRIGIPMIIIYALAKAIKMPISYLPFWSLYCELIYYCLYPLILSLINKKQIILLILFCFSFIVSYLIILINGNAIYDLVNRNSSLNAEYWQFGIILTAIIGLPNWLLGVIIARKFVQLPKPINISIKKIYAVRLAVFLLSMACSVARFHFNLSYTLSLNIFGLFAAYWIWIEINYWATHSTIKLLEHLGKISYSVYICHAIAVFLVSQHFDSGFLTISLEIIATFAFSYFFYLTIEKPSHQLAQKI